MKTNQSNGYPDLLEASEDLPSKVQTGCLYMQTSKEEIQGISKTKMNESHLREYGPDR